jgi:hypothetical protein
MSNENIVVMEKLYCTFPRLTEANQQYVLGLAEGLKKAQNSGLKEQPKMGENGLKKSKGGLWQKGHSSMDNSILNQER